MPHHPPKVVNVPFHLTQVSGSCAAADLETALQLLHLLFVAELRWDQGRLETVLSYVEEHVANQDKDPQERLMALITHVNSQVKVVCGLSEEETQGVDRGKGYYSSAPILFGDVLIRDASRMHS